MKMLNNLLPKKIIDWLIPQLPLIIPFLIFILLKPIGGSLFFKLTTSIFLITFIVLSFHYLLDKKLKLYVNSLIIFSLFILNEKYIFDNRDLFSSIYIIFISIFWSYFLYLLQSFSRRFLFFTIVINLFIICFLVIPLIYFIVLDIKISMHDYMALFQSNALESYEFILEFIGLSGFIFILFLFLINLYLFSNISKDNSNLEKEYQFNKVSFNFLLLFFIFLIHSDLSKINTIKLFKDSYIEYQNELNILKRDVKNRSNVLSNSNWDVIKSSDSDELYVIVFGESVSKNHMQIYNYHRDTTPNLYKLLKHDDLMVFDNIFSFHTHTNPVFKLLINQANTKNNLDYTKSPFLTDLLNLSGFETFWISNQSTLGQYTANAPSLIANSARKQFFKNNYVGKDYRSKYDEVVLDDFNNIIDQDMKKNNAIFIHLNTNHWPYESRYPEEFNKFQDLDHLEGIFGKFVAKESTSQVINEYDNSIFYLDYILDQIISKLKTINNKPVAFFFVSDHGEDVYGRRGHNISTYTPEMTDIPLLMYFNDKYKQKYPNKINQLAKNRGAFIGNDFVYDTLIDIAGLQTDLYDSSKSLANSEFNIKLNDLNVKNPSVNPKYVNYYKIDYRKIQKTNAEHLLSKNIDNKFFPHKVNSLKKLKQVLNDGFRSFEVDLFFDDKTNSFRTGHNVEDVGINFEDFLIYCKNNNINLKKVWLDIKNATSENILQIQKKLEIFDNIYNVKNIFLIETQLTSNLIRKLSDDMWYTSYYLPTNFIKSLNEKKDEENIEKYITKLVNQLEKQNIKSISFDLSIVDFVEKYLNNNINSKIDFNVWYGPSLYDESFIMNIQKDPIYKKNRYKVFLCKYNSQFEL